MRHKGFTLIELLMVIVLLAYAAQYVTAQLNLGGMRLETAARRIAMDIQYAQSLAMSTRSSQRYGIQFEANPTNRYSVYQGNANTPVRDPLTQMAMRISLGTGDSQGIRISSISIPQIEFNAFGSPLLPSGTLLSATATITLSQVSGGSKQIHISPTSGKVTFQ